MHSSTCENMPFKYKSGQHTPDCTVINGISKMIPCACDYYLMFTRGTRVKMAFEPIEMVILKVIWCRKQDKPETPR